MNLEELKKLCDEATPGPWRRTFEVHRYWIECGDEDYVCRLECENHLVARADATFIAAARAA